MFLRVQFKGEKTWVFWVGLIIFALACMELFSILWLLAVISPSNLEYQLKFATPFIVGGLVFIIVGFYMMKSGVKKPTRAEKWRMRAKEE